MYIFLSFVLMITLILSEFLFSIIIYKNDIFNLLFEISEKIFNIMQARFSYIIYIFIIILLISILIICFFKSKKNKRFINISLISSQIIYIVIIVLINIYKYRINILSDDINNMIVLILNKIVYMYLGIFILVLIYRILELCIESKNERGKENV